MAHDVFLSYAEKDKTTARAVCAALEAAGIPCWIAPRNITAGSSWQKAIAQAIPAARLLILILSPKAQTSPHVQTELREAFDLKRLPILPYRIEPTPLNDEFRYMLGSFQILDANDPGPPEPLARLIRDTRSHLHPQATDPVPNEPPIPTETPLKIVLSYRRDTQPDEALTHRIEANFLARGHQVFVDRQAKFSLEWARAIEDRLRDADVLIPLLSAASATSEVLEWEIRTAHEAAQSPGGKPRLLPVRVAFDGKPSPELATLLDTIPPFQWLGPQDDQTLLGELTSALHGPRPIPPPRPLPVGGLPLDSEAYVRRASDLTFLAAIDRHDSIVLVRGARQIGKTSLLARGLDRAERDGARVAFSDLQRLNRADLETPEAFYLALGSALADDLELDVHPKHHWDPDRSANVNFETFLRTQILDAEETPLVWGLDEVDRLFTCGFGTEVFALFRSWHNARTRKRSSSWKRLTLAIGYSTEAHLFITDLNQSPFNVGTQVGLDDFTPEQVADLNIRYATPLKTPKDLKTFTALLDGHPYLTNRALFEMSENGRTLNEFAAQADREEGLFGDHLRRILILLAQDPELCEVVRGILRGKSCPDPASFYRLRAAGLIKGESIDTARLRNALYANYLKKHLI